MLRILYWNIKKKGGELLLDIVKLSTKHDIIILAEISVTKSKLQKKGTSLESIINDITNKTKCSIEF